MPSIAKRIGPPPEQRQLIGATGTSIYGGYLSEEYITDLRGRAAVDVYDEMRRGDAQVRMVLAAIKNPIRSALFKHSAKDGDERSKKIAAFFDWHWFESPFVNWPRFLTEALTHLDFGHSVHEVAFTAHDHPEHGPVFCVGALAFRAQKTIERWVVKGRAGLTGIDQYAYGDTVEEGASQNTFLPLERLLILVNEQEGDNWEGISLLRGAYGSWFRKNHTLKMLMIGAEKAAIGTPVGKYPVGATKDQQDDLDAALGNFTAHESAYITAPTGFEIEIVKNDFDAEKLLATVQYEDAQMSKSVLLNFLELGQNGNGGAYSLGSDLSDMTLASLQYIAERVCERIAALNRQLAVWNFGDAELAPCLTCSGINNKASAELANVVKTLVDAKIVRPDDALEAHMRESFNLPAAETTRAEDEAERAANPPPEPPAPEGGEPAAEGDEDEGGEGAAPAADDDGPTPDGGAPEAKLSEGFTSFRPLSRYEIPLALSEMAAEFEDARTMVTDVMRSHVGALAVYATTQLARRLAQGPKDKLKIAEKIPFETKEYERALLKVMAKAAAIGIRQADRDLAAKSGDARKFADSVKSTLEFLPPHVQEVLKAQAKKQAETHAAEQKKRLTYTVMSGVENDLPDKEIVSDAEDALNEFTSSAQIDGAGRTVASQSVNRGRDAFFFEPENVKQIQAFMYSAVLDDRTTDICLSLDGKIFKTNDPAIDRLRPPNHHGCRSILVPITVNEEPPELTGLDIDPSNKSLLEEYERRGKAPPDMATIKKSRNL